MIGSFGSQTRGGRSRRPVAHINYAEQIDTSISTPASNAVDDGDEDEFTADPETVASDDDQMSDAVPEELEEPEAQESEESESAPKKRGKGSSTTKKQKRPKARWAIEKNVPKSQMQVRHIKQPAEWEGPIPKYHSPNPIRIDIGFEEPIWNLLRNARMDFSKLTIESTPPQSHLPPFADESEDADTSGSSALDMRMLDANAQPLKNSSLRVDVLRAEPLECDTQGWAINAGISVCSIDWVPVAEGTSPKYDFIAVGGMNGTYKENMKFQISTKESTPAPGSIQIWRLNTEEPECQLDMVLVHNFGRCISLKWCPISMPEGSCGDGLPIQGYLAAIFGDGYLRVCGVPAPGAVRAAAEIGDDQTVYMQWPKGVLETKWIHGIFTSLDWVGTGVVMAGTSTGHLTLWSLAESIPAQRRALDHQWPYTDPQPIADHRPADDNEVVPMMALRLHQGAIISAVPMFNDVASPKQPSGFVRIVQRNVQVLTICNGGRMKQISLAFPHRYNHPLVSHPGLPNCFIWLYETGDLVMSDCDNMIRSICHFVSPNTNDPWMLSCLHQPPREQPPGRIHGGRRGVPMYWNDSADCGTIQCVDLLAKALMAQASEFHTYYAVAAEDGDLIVQNSKWLIPAKKITPMYRCIYRLLWEYEDGDVDMDGDVIGDKETTGTNGRLVCVERQPVQNRELKNSASTNFTTIFPPQIAVQACAWSRNRKSSAWIASGGASGLVRIEDVSP
ncbi:hypothetical protein FBU59_000019 [Linderina macrospora]|uniref:Uncharacterized protein n=1 Tax=Linderina macrospora TaxID=4868 RepID=A0ACC1JHP8_9FUNG|nr:hypothetical protein FBU59_000019 [Linderina macrospora]